jgi:hypothetical protein
MIQSNQKTSLLVPYQLPKFITEDPNYSNFVLFLQAYYEWMEEQGNVLDFTKSLKNYSDIDTTSSAFLNYYMNDFMTYFPQEMLADKTKVLKLAKQLYQSKGTPASYQFLFRVLYNTDVDFFYTKDVVLKASAGKWYVPRSLKLASSDSNFLHTANLRVFGENSKSIATIENAIYDGAKTEVFISNIERLFQSGERIIVVDSANQPVYFLNGAIVPSGTIGAETLSSTIVGQISQLIINPQYRGSLYNTNDPIVIYGGLNANTPNPIGAIGTVGEVTSGGVQRISVTTEGYGYTPGVYSGIVGGANTQISFSNVPTNAGIIATVGLLDQSTSANVGSIPVDSISRKLNIRLSNTNYFFANANTTNANTSLANAFTFTTINTNPILSVVVYNSGGGISTTPTVAATSLYNSDNPLNVINGITYYSQTNLATLGVLAPIQIVNGGSGYANGQTVLLLGGTGRGAYANVVSVNSSGALTQVAYRYNPSDSFHHYPNGGMGYGPGLPTAIVVAPATGNVTTNSSSNVVTGNGSTFLTQLSNGAVLYASSNVVLGTIQSITSNTSLILSGNAATSVIANNFYINTAHLVVPGVLGTGATFSSVSNRIGAITTLNILNNGEDYVSAPKVSLEVQDLIVSNVSIQNIASSGDIVYQGANTNTATYLAFVDSINILQNNINPAASIYQMRVYNYTSKPKQVSGSSLLPLKIDSKGASMVLISNYTAGATPTTFNLSDPRFDSANGVIQYGDGTAQANSTFLDGLVIGNGQYLDTSGQPSSFDVIQSTDYNNYTYEITLEKEIAKYRDVLMNLLHPAGMHVIGRFRMDSANSFNYNIGNNLNSGHNLSFYTGTAFSNVSINGSFSSPSNNIINFGNLAGANISNIVFANTSTIRFTTSNNITVESLVIGVNGPANTATLQDSVWLSFMNVAYGTSNTSGNNYININYLTNSYDIVNGGAYSNTQYPLVDIIHAGDVIMVNNATQVVASVNYSNNTVYLQGGLANGANGLISVNRAINSTNVQIFGPVGAQAIWI